MSINKIRENLQNTIAGKERLLEGFINISNKSKGEEKIVFDTTAKFLEMNINELKKILKDVEECCES